MAKCNLRALACLQIPIHGNLTPNQSKLSLDSFVVIFVQAVTALWHPPYALASWLQAFQGKL